MEKTKLKIKKFIISELLNIKNLNNLNYYERTKNLAEIVIKSCKIYNKYAHFSHEKELKIFYNNIHSQEKFTISINIEKLIRKTKINNLYE